MNTFIYLHLNFHTHMPKLVGKTSKLMPCQHAQQVECVPQYVCTHSGCLIMSHPVVAKRKDGQEGSSVEQTARAAGLPETRYRLKASLWCGMRDKDDATCQRCLLIWDFTKYSSYSFLYKLGSTMFIIDYMLTSEVWYPLIGLLSLSLSLPKNIL